MKIDLHHFEYDKDGVHFLILPEGYKVDVGSGYLQVDFGGDSCDSIKVAEVIDLIRRDTGLSFSKYSCVSHERVVASNDSIALPVGMHISELGWHSYRCSKRYKTIMFIRKLFGLKD